MVAVVAVLAFYWYLTLVALVTELLYSSVLHASSVIVPDSQLAQDSASRHLDEVPEETRSDWPQFLFFQIPTAGALTH